MDAVSPLTVSINARFVVEEIALVSRFMSSVVFAKSRFSNTGEVLEEKTAVRSNVKESMHWKQTGDAASLRRDPWQD